jgi:branched-subunit amino acid transport protein
MSEAEIIVVFAGLTAITVITRSFFFLFRRELALPEWVRRGLRYAPLAALAAVVAPDILLTEGAIVTTWQDPKLWAAAASMGYFFLRRDLLGTILVGMIVFWVARWCWS